MIMSTQHEEMLKRFREEFVKDTIMKNVKLVERQEPQELENFFIREIDLAVAEERKRIVGLLKKHADEINFDEWEVGEIIELILKNK